MKLVRYGTFLFAIMLATHFSAYAQTMPGSFKIINNSHPEREKFYISSIEKADMESYRLKNKEVTVHFENGFDCIFTSAKALFLAGKQINATSYQEDFAANFLLPSFNIVSSGNLVAIFPVKTKKYK
jgi:hypothetical protein